MTLHPCATKPVSDIGPGSPLLVAAFAGTVWSPGLCRVCTDPAVARAAEGCRHGIPTRDCTGFFQKHAGSIQTLSQWQKAVGLEIASRRPHQAPSDMGGSASDPAVMQGVQSAEGCGPRAHQPAPTPSFLKRGWECTRLSSGATSGKPVGGGEAGTSLEDPLYSLWHGRLLGWPSWSLGLSPYP